MSTVFQILKRIQIDLSLRNRTTSNRFIQTRKQCTSFHIHRRLPPATSNFHKFVPTPIHTSNALLTPNIHTVISSRSLKLFCPQYKDDIPKNEKVGMVKKFKQLLKDYGWTLIPVHFVTSCGWFGLCYFICLSGVDVVPFLQTLRISQEYIDTLSDSPYTHLALAYLLYEIAKPVRYPFTIGVTTWLVKYKKEDLKTSTEIKKDWKEKVSYSMEKVKDEWAEKMKEKEEYEAKWKEFSEKFKKKKK